MEGAACPQNVGVVNEHLQGCFRATDDGAAAARAR